jgi:phage terminase small subunit
MTAKQLTPKQQAFVAEYLKDRNATQAATRAGYTPKSAKYAARELMGLPQVKSALTRALKEQEKRTLQSADMVLLNLQRIAMAAEKAGEYHAAIRGWEKIGQHYKLFTEKHEHGGIGGGPVQFQITEREADL